MGGAAVIVACLWLLRSKSGKSATPTTAVTAKKNPSSRCSEQRGSIDADFSCWSLRHTLVLVLVPRVVDMNGLLLACIAQLLAWFRLGRLPLTGMPMERLERERWICEEDYSLRGCSGLTSLAERCSLIEGREVLAFDVRL